MTRVRHFDRIDVRWDKATLRANEDGSITVDGFGAHVGNYTYHDDKGRPFIEHVPADTLFEQASLDSAAGSTLTIRHGPGLVTPDRYREEAHGSWVKAWDAGRGLLGVRVRASSADGVEFIRASVAAGQPVELSPVYEVDVLDQPGSTEHGKHDAVQRGRRYSGIALLGPDEARGGPEMRLQLDSNTRAPAGARVQVGPRLDSAPRSQLHSATGRSNVAKQATIKSKGRKRTVTLDALTHLRALTHGDQVETGRVTVEIEGEEASELVLPVSMIEMLLEGIGAPMAAPAPEVAEVSEIEEMAAADAGPDDGKLDAKIARVVAQVLDARESTRRRADARAASIRSDAATILPPAYDYTVSDTQVCLDAIAKADPEAMQTAKALKSKADAGDAEALGMLRQMLAERRRSDTSSSTTTIVTKADDNAPAWRASEMPKRTEK